MGIPDIRPQAHEGVLLSSRYQPGETSLLIDPSELELAQATFNEAEVYPILARFAEKLASAFGRPLHALDACSATGLASHLACGRIAMDTLTLVDIDPAPLRVAGRTHHSQRPGLVLVCKDALEFEADWEFDLILMNSAYHHIEDEEKARFLRRHREMLAAGGRILLGDHFLPSYGNAGEFQAALTRFYSPLVEELRERGTPPAAVRVVEKSVALARRKEVEFKVSFEKFQRDLAAAGLAIEKNVKVWGPTSQEWGTQVLCLIPS